jgi:hypothetical protein
MDMDVPVQNDFEMAAADYRTPSLVRELWGFLNQTKKWWLLPIVLVLVMLGGVLLLSSSVIAPFIYPLF